MGCKESKVVPLSPVPERTHVTEVTSAPARHHGLNEATSTSTRERHIAPSPAEVIPATARVASNVPPKRILDDAPGSQPAAHIITRDELIKHNQKSRNDDKRQQLWAVDTKKVYNGYELYRLLRQEVAQKQSEEQTNPTEWRRFEEKQLYGLVLHFVRGIRLSKDAIEAAKDASFLGNLVEDREKTAREDEYSMKRLGDYLEQQRQSLRYDDDDVYFRTLPEISRKKIREERLMQLLNYCSDGKLVYKGYKLYIVHTEYHSFQRNKRAEKRDTAIARLVEDPDAEHLDDVSLRHLQHDSNVYASRHGGDKDNAIAELYSDDLVKCINRYSDKIKRPRYTSKMPSDGNKVLFPIAEDANIEEFRTWMTRHIPCPHTVQWNNEWSRLDDVPDGIVWEHYSTGTLYFEPARPVTLPWRDNCEPLDTSIVGEAAWSVVPEDIVKNDIATETQILSLHRRESDPGFGSIERITKKRDKLMQYFEKYITDVGIYVGRSYHLEQEWKNFQLLCKTWTRGYVEPRIVPTPLPEVPWQKFACPEKIALWRDSTLAGTLAAGWNEFQELCKS